MTDRTKFQALSAGIVEKARPAMVKIQQAAVAKQSLTLSFDEVESMAMLLILVTEVLAETVKTIQAKK